MSEKQRRVSRIVVRDTRGDGTEYTDIGTVLSNRWGNEDGTLNCKRTIIFGSSNNRNPDYDVSLDKVCELIRLAGQKKSGVFIDLMPVRQRQRDTSPAGQENYENF